MRQLMNDFGMPAFIIAGCAFVWVNVSTLPAPRFDALGSAFFPRLNVLIIIGLCSLLIVRNLMALRKGELNGSSKQAEKAPTNWLRMGTVLVLLCGYVLLIMLTDISYHLLTFCFLFLYGWFLAQWSRRVVLPLLLTAGLVTGLIYVIFGLFLEVFFP